MEQDGEKKRILEELSWGRIKQAKVLTTGTLAAEGPHSMDCRYSWTPKQEIYDFTASLPENFQDCPCNFHKILP